MKRAFKSLFALLTFRLTREQFLEFNNHHLLLGLLFTWIVGIGRWWDDPGANLLQHLGVGSIIYVVVLALLLWGLLWPLNPMNWSYRHVLTFVALTSPPALLYAIPVERFTQLQTAREINVWFLATVATWRVALLLFYLKRHARLSVIKSFTAALLPISAIIVVLTYLNLERAVFDVMGGLRDTGTSHDSAYAILFLLTLLSVFMFPVLLIAYIAMIFVTKSRNS